MSRFSNLAVSIAAVMVWTCGSAVAQNPTKADPKPAIEQQKAPIGPPPELAQLRNAVEAAARKGENVDEIRKHLESLELALAAKPAKFVLIGRVEQTYSKEQKRTDLQTDTLYVIELKEEPPSNGDGVGRTIFVKTWRGTGDRGQLTIPSRGDLIECHLTGGPTSFDAAIPNGIRILHRAVFKSKTLGSELSLVHTGEYRMGSPGDERYRRADESQHVVRMTRPFYLGRFEVTQEEYESIMNANPSYFSPSGGGKAQVNGLAVKRFPVETVSWFDAVEFCNRLSLKDGLPAYYKLAEVKKDGQTITSATVTVLGGNGYRLPSEAEWEFACRAGTTTPFHYGKTSSANSSNVKALIEAGMYGDYPKWKELGRTTTVGSYAPNAWGFHDMHGNVAEWCQDWYDKDYYGVTPRENPPGPEQGSHKVIRGGSWLVNDSLCRSACRFFHLPREATHYAGFRLARTP
jgi:formylglycine-generating enzyme required for sulfatase activity